MYPHAEYLGDDHAEMTRYRSKTLAFFLAQAEFLTLPLLSQLATISTTEVATDNFGYYSTYFPSGAAFSFKTSGGITKIPLDTRTIHVEYTSPIQGPCPIPSSTSEFAPSDPLFCVPLLSTPSVPSDRVYNITMQTSSPFGSIAVSRLLRKYISGR